MKRLAKQLAPLLCQLSEVLKSNLLQETYDQQKVNIYRDMSYEEFCSEVVTLVPYLYFLSNKLRRPVSPDPIAAAILQDVAACKDKTPWKEIYTLIDSTSVKESDRDPGLHFYEEMMAAYDQASRRKLGVYYTPQPIVDFIVRGVEDILIDKFNLPEGFASTKVKALDFAAGTGAFITTMVRKAVSKGVPGDHIADRFTGFEYSLTPACVANVNLASESKRCTGSLVKVADTLKNPTLPTGMGDALVIVGNPPYNGHSRNNGEFITNLIKDYRFIDGQPLNEKKNGLNDDYVKFIRFAQNKMDQVEEGVVGIITNHGFLDNPTFRGMRQSLLETFQQIYILNLHGNVKKRDKSSQGLKDGNIFNVQQGVCITFFIKKPKLEQKIYYADLRGTKDEKFQFCDEKTLLSINWKQLQPTSPNYLFIPFDNRMGEKYNEYWSLRDIFAQNSSGVKTDRDSLTIDFNEEELMRRVKEFSSLPTEIARTKYNLGKDSRDWKISYAQKSLKESNLSPEHLCDINYRPFDTRKIYYNRHSRGFISQPAYKIMRHMLIDENIGLTFVRQIKAGAWQHSFVTKNLMESAYISNKTGEFNYIAPLYCFLDSSSEALSMGPNKIENLTSSFRQWIDQHYQYRYSPEKILGYIYAILHSPTYREAYHEFLKMDFPRVPFAKHPRTFEKLSALGWDMVQVHLMKRVPKYGLGKYVGTGDSQVTKIIHCDKDQKVYINHSQSFSNVPLKLWEFQIGGYQVLRKYLTSRKGRIMSTEEIKNFENIVNILAFTDNQMRTIDAEYVQAEFLIDLHRA